VLKRECRAAQMGPFIDAHHPLLKSGHVDATPDELFRCVCAREGVRP
jgi:hypothetical protein